MNKNSIKYKRLAYARDYFNMNEGERPMTLHQAGSPFKISKTVDNKIEKYGDKALEVALKQYNNKAYRQKVKAHERHLKSFFGIKKNGRIDASKRDIKIHLGLTDMKAKKRRSANEQARNIFHGMSMAGKTEKAYATFAVWLNTADEIFGGIKSGQKAIQYFESEFLKLKPKQQIEFSKKLFNGRANLSIEALYRFKNGNDYDYELQQDITSRTKKTQAVKRDFMKLINSI